MESGGKVSTAERDWDIKSNSEADKAKAEEEERARQWDAYMASVRSNQDAREATYIDPPELSEDTVRERFPKWSDWVGDAYRTQIGNWSANRVVYICHNCGCFGYKTGRTNPLFRCYGCRSRNVTVLRAGELSLAIRNDDVGINMEDVYRERREQQEAQRRARATRR